LRCRKQRRRSIGGFSPLGHAALHLNARPSFGLRDTLQNLHRMDASLLEGFMTQCKGGLQLLAGSQSPQALTPAAAELARLFDLLVAHFRYVVVDARIEWIRPRGCFAISQVPRSWSRKRMSCRCGAQTGFAPTWRRQRSQSSPAGAQPLQEDSWIY